MIIDSCCCVSLLYLRRSPIPPPTACSGLRSLHIGWWSASSHRRWLPVSVIHGNHWRWLGWLLRRLLICRVYTRQPCVLLCIRLYSVPDSVSCVTGCGWIATYIRAMGASLTGVFPLCCGRDVRGLVRIIILSVLRLVERVLYEDVRLGHDAACDVVDR